MFIQDFVQHKVNKYSTVVATNASASPANYFGTSRSGSSTNTHSCGSVTGVPAHLRSASHMKPSGLGQFYQKYTEAYGIPILGRMARFWVKPKTHPLQRKSLLAKLRRRRSNVVDLGPRCILSWQEDASPTQIMTFLPLAND